jgi:hypothetical protein
MVVTRLQILSGRIIVVHAEAPAGRPAVVESIILPRHLRRISQMPTGQEESPLGRVRSSREWEAATHGAELQPRSTATGIRKVENWDMVPLAVAIHPLVMQVLQVTAPASSGPRYQPVWPLAAP